MFSLFPELLFLAPLGALVIRAAAASAFAVSAYDHLSGARSTLWYVLGAVEVAVTLSLALGYGAQAGALAGAALAILWFVIPGARVMPISTALLLIAMCLSIVVIGPGAFAFDLPL